MPDGIDIEFSAAKSDSIEKCHHHFDDFGVGRGSIAAAKNFRANLVELPVSSFLRAFSPEHRAYVVQLHRLGQLLHVVFDISAANTCRRLRAKTYPDSLSEIVECARPCQRYEFLARR